MKNDDGTWIGAMTGRPRVALSRALVFSDPLPGWVGVREPRGRLGGRYAKNVTICPTQACTTG